MLIDLDSFVQNNMILTGGHFMLSNNQPILNSGTIESFKKTASLYSMHHKNFDNLGLGILINDIGSTCTQESCSISRERNTSVPQLPNEYICILDEFGVSHDEVIIFREKHIRNRAKKLLKSMLKLNTATIFYKENEGYFYKCPRTNVEVILTRYNKCDVRGTPACPLIMAAFSAEHQRLGYEKSLSTYYIAEDNYQNIQNHFVIEKGRHIATVFNIKKDDIKNVYVFKDKVLKNFK